MHRPAWNVRQHVAALEHEPLSGTLDLAQPAKGFALRRIGPCRVEGGELFRVEVALAGKLGECVLEEVVARGASVRAVYRADPACPLRLDLFWRVLSCDWASPGLAALDLIVSVSTEELQAQAELAVQSILPATAAWQLTCVEGRSAALAGPIVPPGRCPVALCRPGGLLFHLLCREVSYLEMVNPRDFQGDTVTSASGLPPVWEVRHRLLGGMLEKGVILRARLRAVFCERPEEQAQAAAAYAALAAADPPLSD